MANAARLSTLKECALRVGGPELCQIDANLKRTNRLRRAELLRENRKRRVLGTKDVDQRSL